MLSKLFILSFLFILSCNFIQCEVSLIDTECKTNDDCSPFKNNLINATCQNLRCFCYDQLNKSIDCVPNKSKISNIIGAPCPCFIENANCDKQTSKCNCNNEYMPSIDKRSCIKKSVHLGDDCESNDQCINFERFSNCDMDIHKCMCQRNFTQIQQTCRSRIPIGKQCENDLECRENTNNTSCIEHKCVCDKTLVANIDGTMCLPSAGFYENCIESQQCIHKLGVGSKCDSGVCVCDSNHFNITVETDIPTVICEVKRFIGDSCADHTDCYQYHIEHGYGQSMVCEIDVCTCREGYEKIDKSCYKKSSALQMSSSFILILIMFNLVFNFQSN